MLPVEPSTLDKNKLFGDWVIHVAENCLVLKFETQGFEQRKTGKSAGISLVPSLADGACVPGIRW